MDLFVLLLVLSPALACLVTMAVAWVVRVQARRRDGRPSCRGHVRTLLPTSIGLVELCATCDAGSVVDGRWEFAPPVEADHSL